MRPEPGTVLGGRYELTSRIAVGGMGEVWRGRDTILSREIAAKIMKEEYLSDSSFLERFRAEAVSMGAVSDPGIAGVYDYGEENSSPYLVMEYVPGEPLSAIIDRNAALSVRDALDITAQSAQALASAHNAGVIHRDIKPGNLLVTPDFKVKITDFGIARAADQAPLTKTGQVMGTAQYLAPEQATGKGSVPQSDLYSLGVILYEMLAGKRPFTGDSQVEIAIAQVNRPHPPLPDTIPEPVRRLVDLMLSKKPEQRPESGMAVATAARALMDNDLAAAQAAIPQLAAGAAAGEAVTRVFQQPTEATRVIPATSQLPAVTSSSTSQAPLLTSQQPQTGSGNADHNDEKRMSGGAKAGIIIGIIALLALLGWGTWAVLGNDGTPSPAPAATSAAPSTTAATVTLNPDDYIGLSESSATQNLEQLGLKVRAVTVASDSDAGTVTRVREGDNGYTFDTGDTVTIEVSSGQSSPKPSATKSSQPTATPTQETTSDPEPTSKESTSGSDSDDDTGSQTTEDSGSGDSTENGNAGGSDSGSQNTSADDGKSGGSVTQNDRSSQEESGD